MSAITRRLVAHRIAVLLFFAALSVASGLYVRAGLGINTDTKDLLDAELDWRRLDVLHNRLFPQYNETILLAVEADTADRAEDAAWALYHALQAEAGSPFPDLYYPEALAFFRHNRFLFPDLQELEELAGRLVEAQAPLGSLAADPSLRGLGKLLGLALEAGEAGELGAGAPGGEEAGEPGGGWTLPGVLSASLAGLNAGSPRPLSWAALLDGSASGSASGGPHRRLIVTRMQPDFSGLLPAQEAILALRRQAEALDLKGRWGAELRLGGEAILAHEELQSVTRGNWLALALSLTLVTVLLRLHLGPGMMLACLLTLLCGLILTTALATLTLGELNLISVAFAVLYIGLGIDFAIHYTLAWRAGGADSLGRAGAQQEDDAGSLGRTGAQQEDDAGSRGRTGTQQEDDAGSLGRAGTQQEGDADSRGRTGTQQEGSAGSLGRTSAVMIRPLLLCALTTACGFFSFMPTDYRGVAELGWIAGCGMFISCGLSLTLLPVLLSFSRQAPDGRRRAIPDICALALRRPRAVLVTSALLGALALARLGDLSFTADTLALQDPNNESVQLYRALVADSQDNPHSLLALSRDRDQARQLAARFRALPQVQRVIWLEDFIPEQQEEKMAVIADLQLLLGDLSGAGARAPVPEAEELQALRKLQQRLDGRRDLGGDWARLRDTLGAAIQAVERGQLGIDAIRKTLLQGLDGRLRMLDEALQAGPVSEASLPESLKRRWYNDGYYQLMILPRETLDNSRALGDFVQAASAIHGEVTGAALLQYQAAAAVQGAFRQAFLYALGAITLLLAVLLRSLRDSLAVLLILLLGSCLCAGCMLLLHTPFNFANIIALPLLLGIGVDSGIHILHCYRQGAGDRQMLAARGRAVIVSALTTVLSIGSLAFSAHLGTASLGILLALGIVVMAGCMVLVLPALLSVADTAVARTRAWAGGGAR